MALCQRQARVNAGCKQPERIFEKIRRRRDSQWLSRAVVIRLTINAFYSSRSEEHTSELQSLMRISYAVFCLKKKKIDIYNTKILQLQTLYTYDNNRPTNIT